MRFVAVTFLTCLGCVTSAGSARANAPTRLVGSQGIDGRGVTGLVAFTFDDGPDYLTTPPVLEVLDEEELKATFFVVGRRFDGQSPKAVANRAVLGDILARGHLVGNHTFTHLNLSAAAAPLAIADVDRNERAITRHAGLRANLFRAPYGVLSDTLRRKLDRRGYVVVGWNIDSQDYAHRARSVSSRIGHVRHRVVSRILEKGGGVVLFHDTKQPTAEVLHLVLEDLQRANCARIAAGEHPIVPAELDWFATDAAGNALPVPEDVRARTEATRQRIHARCAATPPERGHYVPESKGGE